VHPSHVSSTFRRLYTEADLPPIRLHDLRHTAASLALQAGVPMKIVSEQLGHSWLSITADTYTSLLPGVAHAAAESVADLVAAAAPRSVERALKRARGGGVSSSLAPGPPDPPGEPPRASARRKAAGQSMVVGAPGRDRTCDPRIRSPLLCPLSYGGPAPVPGASCSKGIGPVGPRVITAGGVGAIIAPVGGGRLLWR